MPLLKNVFSSLFGQAPALSRDTRRALARAVETVEPQLNLLSDLEARLGPAVDHALGYSASLVERLPGPRDIGRAAFASDPLIHALFATAADVEQTLGKSQAVRDYLQEPASYAADHFYALFAARRSEKKQMGTAACGEVIRADVPQTVLYFSDQTITEPVGAEDRMGEQLRCVFFDSLLKNFSAHLTGLREEQEAVRAGLSVERAHLTVLRGKTAGPEYAVHTRRHAELDEKLRELAGVLAPAALAEALAEFLRQPEASLRLQPYAVTVDRLGIVSAVSGDASGDGCAQSAGLDTLRFPEIVARDRRRYMVMRARIDCAEAREAVARVDEAQRRFIVI